MAKSAIYTLFQLLQILESSTFNQVLEDVGYVGKLVPYDRATGNKIVDGSADVGEVPAPIGDLYITENRTIKIVRIGSPNTVIGEIGLTAAGGIYTKITKTYSDFATAGLTNTIDLFTLPAKTRVTDTFVKHDTQFLGGGITAYQIGCGVTGDLNKLSYDFDVFQAVASDTGAHYRYGGIFDMANPTTLKITAKSVGANLNVATQGVVQIQLDLKVLV